MRCIVNIMKLSTPFLFLFGCSFFDIQSRDYEKIADQITERTAKKLKAEKGLVLAGTGGQMMNDIQMMMIGFNFYKEVDIETARRLLVDSVQEYLSAINSSDELRPFLHSYPFTPKNVEIVIYFYDPQGSNVSPDKISIAAARQGKLTYYIDYPEKHTIKAIQEEPYQDALKAVYSLSVL